MLRSKGGLWNSRGKERLWQPPPPLLLLPQL
jgi:hypothetical protein